MFLLQEAIAAGGYFIHLLIILAGIIVLGVIAFLIIRSEHRSGQEIETGENTTKETKRPSVFVLMILFGLLIAAIVFGNWLCNIKLD
jgi:C4-dicarboxylate transporter